MVILFTLNTPTLYIVTAKNTIDYPFHNLYQVIKSIYSFDKLL